MEEGGTIEDLLPPTEQEIIAAFRENLIDMLGQLENRNASWVPIGDQIELADLQALSRATLHLSEGHTKLAQAYGELRTIFNRLLGVNELSV
ncbi:MAG: hypothetical protein ACLQJR_01875 [Stellaceae bacterium]